MTKKTIIKNKKAYLEADIISFVIIIIFLFILVFALNFFKLSDFEVKYNKDKLNNDLMLVNLLRIKTPEGTMADTIILDYSQNDFTITKNELNKIFEKSFGKKICYTLFVGEKTINEHNDCTKINEILSNFEATAHLYYGNRKIDLVLR